MENLNKSLNFIALREALKSVLPYLWHVYSEPTPVGKGVLTLLSMCFIIAMVTGGLLYNWLSETLKYDHETSIKTVSIYSVAIFFSSFLCHPLRCVLTIAMPTLCSKQGRKLIISTSVIIVMLNVIPNITMNIGAVVHILKCVSEGFARTLLNSTDLLNRAKTDLVWETIKVKREDLTIVTSLRKLDHYTHIDVSEVKNRFTHISGQIERNFSSARNLLKDCKLQLNRILAAIFVILLIVESARYLKCYLTSLQFDNVYLSTQLLQKATTDGKQILSAENMIHSTSCKMTNQEWPTCFISFVMVTLYFSAIAFIIALDHIVYHLVQISVPWLLDVPTTSASISVTFKVLFFPPAFCIFPKSCVKQELTNFHRDYEWILGSEPSRCEATPSPPDLGVRALLAILWLMSYFLVFLQVYARRMRRKVSASFFKEREEKRIAFLLKKIQAKQDRKEQGIVSVDVSHG
ncbi:osteoclast stimulatory transmembrane protein [Polymixia lowei]